MEIKKSIHGIDIGVYKPKGYKQYHPKDIYSVLNKFKLNEALRLIGELSRNILDSYKGSPYLEINGVPISDSVLAYITMILIESTDDYSKNLLTVDEIEKVSDMYYGLPEPFINNKNIDELLLRFGSFQFDYDREINNIVPRAFLIYSRLWHEVDRASNCNIENAIQEICGLSIEEILVFGYAFFGASEKGFFRKINQSKLKNKKDEKLFSEEKQDSFIEWISCSYGEFRVKSDEMKNSLPSLEYEKNRFNPLIINPVIKPDIDPVPSEPPVNLVPISRLLLERVTRGLYFDFSDYFMGPNKKNDFREAFGYVFQEYVGHIIKNSKSNINLYPEWQYTKPERSTPDWIILMENDAVFIEVKQSGLFLQSKTLSETESIKNDLSKTIAKAVQQLWQFEKDIFSDRFEELSILSSIKTIQRLVITYDRTYFSNSILKSIALTEAKKKDPSIPDNFNWHTISVEEFERLLALNELSIFDLLKKKEDSREANQWDFREYMARRFPDAKFSNPYLERIKEEFIEHVYAKI